MYKVFNFTKSTGAAPVTQQVTGCGFLPKGLILWSAVRTSSGSWAAPMGFAVGMSDGSTSRSACVALRNGVSFAAMHSYYSSKAIVFCDYNGTKLAEAAVTFINDGIELNWTTNDGNAYYMHGVVFGGIGFETELVEWDVPNGNANITVSGVSFQPDAVIHLTNEKAAADTHSASLALSIGMMDSSGRQIALVANGNGGYPIGARAQLYNTGTLGGLPSGVMGGVSWLAAYSSMNADGFTLSVPDAVEVGTIKAASLCLRGNTFYVGNFDEADATGVQAVTSPGFVPEGVLFISANGNINTQVQYQFSIGAMDATAQAVASAFSQHGVATSNCGSISKTNKCLHAGYNDDSLTDEAEYESLNAGGFSVDWTTQTNDFLDHAYMVWGVLGSMPNPLLIVAPASFHHIDVSWGSIDDAEGYSLERSDTGLGGWAEIANTSDLYYGDDDRQHSTTYYYRVRAYIGAEYSEYSDIVSGTTPPGAPTLHASSGGLDSIGVSWGAVTGATDYSIERSPDGLGDWVEVTDTDQLSDTYSGLSPNTTYWFRGRAYYDVYMIYGEYSAIVSAKTGAYTPVPTPTKEPYPGLTVWTGWSTITTLQSKKVPWAHRSSLLQMPGWMGKDARIKSTDPALGKLVAKFKREGHRVLGDFTYASRSVQSPGVSSWSVEAKESVYDELYRWAGDVDLDIRFQNCGYVDDPTNWQMIKRLCKTIPTDMGTAGETIIDADDNKETMINMTMSSNRHQIMIYRVAPKNLMLYNEEELVNYEYPEIVVGDGLECGYYIPALDGLYSYYKLVYWNNDNVGMMGSALLPHEPLSISSDDNTIVVVVLSDGSVYWSNDCGRTFYASTGVANGLVVDVYSHNNVLVGCTSGIYRSMDGGRTFSDVDPYHAAATDVVAICHHDDKIAYALCDNSAVAMSEDGGETFMKLSTCPIPYPKDMAVLDGMIIVSGYDGTGAPVIYGTDDGNYWKELLHLDGSIFYGSFTHTPKVKLAASGCGVITASVIRNDNKYGLQHSELYRNVNWGMPGCWEPIWEDYRPLWDVSGLWFVTDIACSDVNDIMAVGRILGADPLYFGLRFISGEVWRVKAQ